MMLAASLANNRVGPSRAVSQTRLALLPRDKAALIHYRRDRKTLGSGVEDDEFDALYIELIPTVWTIQADHLREFQLFLANPPA